MSASSSTMLPTLILEPKPLTPWGQRKAREAPPNPDRPRPIMPTRLRLKNWRRLTPRAIGSGATNGSSGADSTVTTSSERAAAAAASTSRPVGADELCPASTGLALSRFRVSRERPEALRSRRFEALTNTTAARTTSSTTAMATPMVSSCGPSGERSGNGDARRSQLEEDARVPREDEVETRTSEERSDHD